MSNYNKVLGHSMWTLFLKNLGAFYVPIYFKKSFTHYTILLEDKIYHISYNI